ncbi:hypothetical protein ACQE30_11410 [Staphylococcus cohnii]|uniref:DUF2975 domain-containing protein n=2 Tax=Staphylococcus cohnii TaxID=29382 RepID=A0ABT6J4E4_9STAP|nr:hypothetical protein [Staphylococcus cohnii]TGP60369.1 hypothetical protein EN872_11310 [bacterium M00.F.Ca.ET.229.01.1.1]TGS36936.1 hypothetical protein EN823_11305 [bacterium M00.F.Ca.ET.180.01.1.1]AYX90204.1 hypothetical protein EGX68_08055 [Staphylococcus cohnii]KKI62658.1 hypothetical protein UF66_2042 [Staphylococcus cohnii subsp. cohnii]MCI2942139.1 hypothetical protein [Staphylococcus cohnii]
MLSNYWKHLMICAVIVNLISIKGFPMAIGAIYLPILFKIIQLQINLSHGLVDKVNASTFVKSNQTGIIISVICCIVITVLLFKPLGGFYNSLTGFLGLLITVSPVTMVIGAILLVLTAIGIIQAAKMKFNDVTITKG